MLANLFQTLMLCSSLPCCLPGHSAWGLHTPVPLTRAPPKTSLPLVRRLGESYKNCRYSV